MSAYLIGTVAAPPAIDNPITAAVAKGNEPAVRLHELDSLRGVAATAVVLTHYTSTYQSIYGHTSPPLFALDVGTEAVNLFFGNRSRPCAIVAGLI